MVGLVLYPYIWVRVRIGILLTGQNMMAEKSLNQSFHFEQSSNYLLELCRVCRGKVPMTVGMKASFRNANVKLTKGQFRSTILRLFNK